MRLLTSELMSDIKAKLQEFRSIQGYFLSDIRAMSFIQGISKSWYFDDIKQKISLLGLRKFIPDHQFHHAAKCLMSKVVREGIDKCDMKLFDSLRQTLSYIDDVNFCVSKFLCAHKPNFFPIWDNNKIVIRRMEDNQGTLTYGNLKKKIDELMSLNGCSDLDYFMFNKLLWYCQ